MHATNEGLVVSVSSREAPQNTSVHEGRTVATEKGQVYTHAIMGMPAAAADRARDWSVQKLIRGSRYPSDARRDERIDLLRGLFVAMMVIDHIAAWSPLRTVTGDAEFYVTAAEGFVSISGFVFGIVYRRVFESGGPGSVLRRATRRSFILYVTMLVASLVLGMDALAAGLHWGAPIHNVREFGLFGLRVATFQIMFPIARILGTYAILLLVGGLGIVALAHNRTRALLVPSFGLYLFYQVSPSRLGWPFPDTAYFHPYAYQVLFLTFMAIGYHRDRLAAVIDTIWQRRIFIVSALGFAGLVVLFLAQRYVLPVRVTDLLEKLFYREYLRPGRIAATAVVAPFLYLLTTYAWTPIRRHLGGLFLPIGRHSLYCYVMHMPIIPLFASAAASWSVLAGWSTLLNGAAQLAVLGLLCVMVRFRFLFRLFPD